MNKYNRYNDKMKSISLMVIFLSHDDGIEQILASRVMRSIVFQVFQFIPYFIILSIIIHHSDYNDTIRTVKFDEESSKWRR
jgi:TM2 domain-containing membrane protein YozV